MKLTSTLGLAGLESLAFGPDLPELLSGQYIEQNYPNDPKYASWTHNITVDDAGLIDITINGPRGTDLDLYLLWDANTDGKFDWDTEVVAKSATDKPAEHIRHYLPSDGAYHIAVHGFDVPEPTTFDARILVLDGKGIKVITPVGAIIPGKEQTITLNVAGAVPGAQGLVFLGPPDAPSAIPLPVGVKD
jgi:hypothetical protein